VQGASSGLAYRFPSCVQYGVVVPLVVVGAFVGGAIVVTGLGVEGQFFSSLPSRQSGSKSQTNFFLIQLPLLTQVNSSGPQVWLQNFSSLPSLQSTLPSHNLRFGIQDPSERQADSGHIVDTLGGRLDTGLSGFPVVGLSVSGFPVVGFFVLGFPVVDLSVSGFPVVGFFVAGFPVVGLSVSGFPVVGFNVLGFPVVGLSVSGLPVVGFFVLGFPVVGFSVSGFPVVGTLQSAQHFSPTSCASFSPPGHNGHFVNGMALFLRS